MATTLGERLKQAREARGVSLREISDQTRIATRYLEAIENNDYKVLPGGVFNKGFIKSFAKYVGVDDKEALDEYNQFVAQQGGDEEEQTPYDPRSNSDLLADNGSGSQWLTMLVALGILAALTGAVVWFVRSYQSQSETPAANVNRSNANGNVSNLNSNAVSSNANSANANTNSTVPATDSIKVELKASPEAPFYSFVADGVKSTKQPKPDEVLTFTPQQSLAVSFSKYFVSNVQLTVNGKPISLPSSMANKQTINFTIDKSNIAQILQSGEISPAAAAPTR